MKLLTLLFLLLSISNLAFTQDFTIRGAIYNKSDGEPMPFEKVRLLKTDSSTVTGAITDVNGYFSM